MSVLTTVIELHDLDQLRLIARDDEARTRWRRMGLPFVDPEGLEAERERQLEGLDRHWRLIYERGFERYGSGLTRVLGRVCQGCFVTFPISAAPPSGQQLLHVCQSCGRLLLWG